MRWCKTLSALCGEKITSAEPVDEYLNKVESVESNFRSLQADIACSQVNKDLGRIDSQLHDLPATIQQIRSRGYVFKSYLERKAEVLAQQ